jgi:hypothetical protein
MNRIIVTFVLSLAFTLHLTSSAAADNCTDAQRDKQLKSVRAKADANHTYVSVSCDLDLKSTDTITKQIRIEGSAASGITIDCNGATLDGAGTPAATQASRIQITAKRSFDTNKFCITESNGRYCAMDRPEDITVRQCKIKGRVDVGLHLFKAKEEEKVINGEKTRVVYGDPKLRFPQVSYQADFTDAARRNAPRDIYFEDVTITVDNDIAIYIYPGVRGFHLTDSGLYGTSDAVAVAVCCL